MNNFKKIKATNECYIDEIATFFGMNFTVGTMHRDDKDFLEDSKDTLEKFIPDFMNKLTNETYENPYTESAYSEIMEALGNVVNKNVYMYSDIFGLLHFGVPVKCDDSHLKYFLDIFTKKKMAGLSIKEANSYKKIIKEFPYQLNKFLNLKDIYFEPESKTFLRIKGSEIKEIFSIGKDLNILL